MREAMLNQTFLPAESIPSEIWHEILSDVVSSYLDLAITEPPPLTQVEINRTQAILVQQTSQSVNWDEWDQLELSRPLPPNTIQPLLAVSHQFRETTMRIIVEALGPEATLNLESGRSPEVSPDLWNGLKRARMAYRARRVLNPRTLRPAFQPPTTFLAAYISLPIGHLPPLSVDCLGTALWRRLFCRLLNNVQNDQAGTFCTIPTPLLLSHKYAVHKATTLNIKMANAVDSFLSREARSIPERIGSAIDLRDSVKAASEYDPTGLPSELVRALRMSHLGWRIAKLSEPPLSALVFPDYMEHMRLQIQEIALQLVEVWTKHELVSTYYRLL
ncbi:hypothetical protein B0H10DRAFT_2041231 [Mycena sp. CBHHK59/15]|nr:hypothetical protein B0H10DRAFT_2041231 [Mycena sp. CBHHK59/15]